MTTHPCATPPGPPFGYACVDDFGNPVATTVHAAPDGTPLVQGPLVACGDGTPMCEGDAVSACISDTDGAPTTYGPAPAAPPTGDVHGRSPHISRVRVNRTGLTPLPYSTTKKPDQLIDFVIDGGDDPDVPVPFNAATGRFTFPPPGTPIEPESPCNSGITEAFSQQSVDLPGVTIPPATTDYLLISTPDATVHNPDDSCDRRMFVELNVPTTLVDYEYPNDAVFRFDYSLDAGATWTTYAEEYPTPRLTSSHHGYVGGASGVLPLLVIPAGASQTCRIRGRVTTDADSPIVVSQALSSVRLWTMRLHP